MFDKLKKLFKKKEEPLLSETFVSVKDVKAKMEPVPETSADDQTISVSEYPTHGPEEFLTKVVSEVKEDSSFANIKSEFDESPKLVASELKKKDKNICDIVTNETELRLKSEDTTVEECENIGLWDKLRATLLNEPEGLALTANQIGIRKNAFLICLREKGKVKKEMKFVNAKILDSQNPVRFDGEGCLSFPGKFINTARYSKITVKDDINGEKEYRDYLAIILQHEIDHLNGVLFMDRKLPEPFKRSIRKVGRNEPCPCGSGKKYKKCCLK